MIWTRPRILELKYLVQRRFPDKQIAKKMGCTLAAVRAKRFKLKARKYAKQKQFDDVVTGLARASWTDKAIGELIQRSKSQVTDIRRRLKVKAGRFA